MAGGEGIDRFPLHGAGAPFDRLRVRKIVYGPWQGPFSFYLTLSLSKDALETLQH